MRYITLFFLVLFLVPEGRACTSAVISGRITPDGRPLLWKNRDTDFLQNSVKFFQGAKYSFIGIVNSSAKHPDEVWMGTNSAGFSLMNTQSYNLEKVKEGEERGTANGRVIRRALEVCATVADFRHFLDTISKPSYIEANLGAIDAQGGAGMFEVGYTKYTFYDANNLKDCPSGYIARTNFSFSGEENKGAGYIRYTTEDQALKSASTIKCITPGWIFNHLARSFVNPLLGIKLRDGQFNLPVGTGWTVDQDFIARNSTACSVVVQGVKKGENPDLTVMWTVLGYPPVSVAFPVWVKGASSLLPSLLSSNEDETVTPLGRKVDTLKEKVFSYHQGMGADRYLHWEELYNLKGTGMMQQLAPVEMQVFRRSAPVIADWRSKGVVNIKEMQQLYSNLSTYITSKYNLLFGL
jgi:hypothetical protein